MILIPVSLKSTDGNCHLLIFCFIEVNRDSIPINRIKLFKLLLGKSNLASSIKQERNLFGLSFLSQLIAEKQLPGSEFPKLFEFP